MPLIANENGVIQGTFTIPESIPAGAKSVLFEGTASRASATFVGQGTLNVRTMQDVTTFITRRWNQKVDPLAQTFTLDRDVQLAGVDLWFTAIGGDVRVQLRETEVGFPSRTVLAHTRVEANSIATATSTRVLFEGPVALKAETEYALVIMADDAVTELALAEVGTFDTHKQTWVTAQPYTVGTLLSSSNASTWTAHQDKDLAFRLLEARFTPDLAVNLGTMELTNHTDVMLFGIIDTPSTGTSVNFELTMPDGGALRIANGQTLRLDAPTSGTMSITAHLTGTEAASPVLYPGTQALLGTVAAEADYYSRSIPATGATKAVLVYDALVPSGATVTAEIQKDNGTWAALTVDGTTEQGDGLVEYRLSSALSSVDSIKIRLLLTGSSAARPRVRNIRLMAVM